MKLRELFLAYILIGWSSTATPACDATATSDPAGYGKAVNRITKLPEYAAWSERVRKAGAKIALLSYAEKQELHDGKCYWSVTFYEEYEMHRNPWQTLLVPAKGPILVKSFADGEVAPLRPSPARSSKK
jgi:hypothetical protein